MKINKFFLIQLWIGVSAFVLFAGQAEGRASEVEMKSFIQKGDERLMPVTEAGCREAITEYDAALKTAPDHYEANWKIARAYCLILDIKTAGLIEEKEEYKPLLKEFGEKAESYAEKAYTVNPKGVEGLTWYSASYAYHASSMGILQAILKGAGGKLKKLANELIAVDDAASDALGYRLLGRLYFSAPFPVGNKTKALEYFKKSVEKAPGSLFNHYWLGEAYRAKEKEKEARIEYQFVLDHPPTENEKHFSDSTREAARQRLKK